MFDIVTYCFSVAYSEYMKTLHKYRSNSRKSFGSDRMVINLEVFQPLSPEPSVVKTVLKAVFRHR